MWKAATPQGDKVQEDLACASPHLHIVINLHTAFDPNNSLRWEELKGVNDGWLVMVDGG